MAKQKMTIDDLAVLMGKRFDNADQKTSERFDDADKQTDKKIENLAAMVADGFYDMGKKIDSVGSNLDNKIETLRTEMHDEFRRIHEEINDIKVKLDQLSQRTLEDDDALNKEVLNLRRRIETLEKQFKLLKSAKA